MLLSEIIKSLQEYAPVGLEFENDVIGLQVGSKLRDKTIKRVLITIAPTLNVLQYACQLKCTLIISYYPLVEDPTNRFNDSDFIKKFWYFSHYKKYLFVLNNSFDVVENGFIEILARKLILRVDDVFQIKNSQRNKVNIGRICSPIKSWNKEKIFRLKDLNTRMLQILEIKVLKYLGNVNREINKICIAEIVSEKLLRKSVELSCDCYITRNIDYKIGLIANDLNVCLIETFHHAETVVMKELHKLLSLEFPRQEFYYYSLDNPFSYDYLKRRNNNFENVKNK